MTERLRAGLQDMASMDSALLETIPEGLTMAVASLGSNGGATQGLIFCDLDRVAILASSWVWGTFTGHGFGLIALGQAF